MDSVHMEIHTMGWKEQKMSDLKNKIMDTYDVRPSTAEYILNIIETIVMIVENEYTAGCSEAMIKYCPNCKVKRNEYRKNS